MTDFNDFKIVSEYDHEIPQSDPWHRESEPQNNHQTPGKEGFKFYKKYIF